MIEETHVNAKVLEYLICSSQNHETNVTLRSMRSARKCHLVKLHLALDALEKVNDVVWPRSHVACVANGCKPVIWSFMGCEQQGTKSFDL